jgi:hypothetical protein
VHGIVLAFAGHSPILSARKEEEGCTGNGNNIGGAKAK